METIQKNFEKEDDDATNEFKETLSWRDLYSLFSNLNEKDQSSWTEENFAKNTITGSKATADNGNDNDDKNDQSSSSSAAVIKNLKPGAFLSPTPTALHASSNQQKRGYSSFIVQHDKETMEKLLVPTSSLSLPMIHLPIHNQDYNQNGTTSNMMTMEEEKQNQTQNMNDNQEFNVDVSLQSKNEVMKMKYSPCIWFFYGRNDIDRNDTIMHIQNLQKNNNNETVDQTKKVQEALCGRPEHTDSVSHHGTWHYQLSGVKEWHLRPTEELLRNERFRKDINPKELELWNSSNSTTDGSESDGDGDESEKKRRRITISCQEGDVLLVNTRLWWHSTTIPEQPIENGCDTVSSKMEEGKEEENHYPKRSVPSVSYARDIYLTWDDDKDTTNNNISENENDDGNDGTMTNLDGLYASNDIKSGTIIFREEDMPDCELHRAKDNPNCEVVEFENGSGAVVSCRDIKAGEFFCLLESDDDDNDSNGSGSYFEEDEGCTLID